MAKRLRLPSIFPDTRAPGRTYLPGHAIGCCEANLADLIGQPRRRFRRPSFSCADRPVHRRSRLFPETFALKALYTICGQSAERPLLGVAVIR